MTALGDKGPIVVVGGGPAGALLSILLSRHGHEVTVYESRPDLRTSDIGAGRSINLALATRGIVALRDVGVMDEVGKVTIAMRGRMVHDHDGNTNLQPYGIHTEDVVYSVGRNDLNAILLDAAEATGRVQIRFRQRCLSVDFDRSVAIFTDYSDDAHPEHEVPFGTVFGADGANSPVRASMLRVNGGHFNEDVLEHGYRELTIPATADGDFQLEPDALHIWPRGGFMIIALPNPGGNFTATVFLPHSGSDNSFEALASSHDIVPFFEREFPDFLPLIPNLVEDFFDGPVGTMSTIRGEGWSYGDQAVLVGDAAHGIVPFHGQGMNAAMESGLVLDRFLRERTPDIAAAFAAYEMERRPDAFAIGEMALSNYIEMRSDVTDPDYLLKRELSLELERRHPDRFHARYGMVMFHTMGYAEARLRAERQDRVLERLVAGKSSMDEIDFDLADALVSILDPIPPSQDGA